MTSVLSDFNAKSNGWCKNYTSVQDLMERVPSQVSWVQCHRAIVPSWVFRGSKIFSRGFFVSPDFLLVVNTWVRNLFSWVFGYFVGAKFFLLGISLAENFFSWVFRESESFSREYFVGPFFFLRPNFLIQRFSVARCMRRSDRNRNTKIHLKPRILF